MCAVSLGQFFYMLSQPRIFILLRSSLYGLHKEFSYTSIPLDPPPYPFYSGSRLRFYCFALLQMLMPLLQFVPLFSKFLSLLIFAPRRCQSCALAMMILSYSSCGSSGLILDRLVTPKSLIVYL